MDEDKSGAISKQESRKEEDREEEKEKQSCDQVLYDQHLDQIMANHNETQRMGQEGREMGPEVQMEETDMSVNYD